MKKSMKAALLSALVFPGVGHFYLKRHLVGLVLTSVTCVALYHLISRLMERAIEIAERIELGGVQLDFPAISELMATQTAGGGAPSLDLASLVLVVLWVAGIVDSYLVGCGQDASDGAGS